MKLKLMIALAGALTLLSMVALRMQDPFFIETARLKGLDYYQRGQEKVKAENIAVVQIDEASLEANGQWPWKRTVLADGVKKAMDSGASLVVLPIIFAEPDRLGGDAEFVKTLSELPVIVSQSASQKGKGVPVPRGLATIGGDSDEWLFNYPAAIGPLQEIGQSSAGVGMLLTAPELDGVIRRLPLVIRVGQEKYPTLPLEVLRVFGGESSNQAKVDEGGIVAIRVAGIPPIKTDGNARVWLNMKYQFPTVSYRDENWGILKDKIAVIAPTAEGLANTVATPLGTSYGYEVNMQALQMLIDGNRLERLAEFDLYELMAGIGISLLVIVLAIWAPYWLNGLMMVAISVVPYLVGVNLFSRGYLVDYTWPVAAGFLTWSVSIFFRFISEFRQKQQIKKQFGTYLSPDMVEKLQKNPELLKLGGETRQLSIMFTDVRGFTAISEHYGSDVQGLTRIMNRYMTAMTQSILDNRGTLDKYIGDAQMAFWNAPLDDPNHALNAVKTGLQMLDNLSAFNAMIAEEGVPAFGMGLGINTGSVVVGNMGSSQRFDYTCLGDSVNLASRLEGQSKPYGVKMVIGPETWNQVNRVYPTLELDLIAVKGKKEGVRIFTVFKPEEDSRIDASMHAKFLYSYRERDWDNAKVLAGQLIQKMPFMQDYYEMMLERIEQFENDDPGKGWDGVFRATSK